LNHSQEFDVQEEEEEGEEEIHAWRVRSIGAFFFSCKTFKLHGVINSFRIFLLADVSKAKKGW
jgi:hypothetical protein